MLSTKFEERIVFMQETNELLKLNDSKNKAKIEELRNQLK